MSGWEAMQQGAPDPFFAEGRKLTEGEADEFWGRGEIVLLDAEREFVGDDGHDWHVVRFPSIACGANYADVERVDGSKQSVRQAELLRRAGIRLPEVTE